MRTCLRDGGKNLREGRRTGTLGACQPATGPVFSGHVIVYAPPLPGGLCVRYVIHVMMLFHVVSLCVIVCNAAFTTLCNVMLCLYKDDARNYGT